MTDRYERIRKALEMGPTPGPWTVKSHAAPRADNGDIGIINRKGMLVAAAYSNTCTRGNASLIAACDPDTIRTLLEERDALRAERDELAEQLRLRRRPPPACREAAAMNEAYERDPSRGTILATICEELKIEPKDARKRLRAAGMSAPYDDVEKIRAVLTK